MAGATLCVSCAQLPKKDRSLAITKAKCPDCQIEFGITSYGSPFRIKVRKRSLFLSPGLLTGAILGAGLFTFAAVLIALGIWSKDQMVRPARVPDRPANELAGVPEVAVDEAFPAQIDPVAGKQRVNSLITRIRGHNTPKDPDAFLIAQMDRRKELRGLPFVMGNACRTDQGRAVSFQNSVQAVRNGLEQDMHSSTGDVPHHDQHSPFWNVYLANQSVDTEHGVAALTQILGPETKTMRSSLVERLKLSNRPEATKALARAAVFDASGDVRLAALKALKNRKNNEDVGIINEMLMHGMRYPMPVIAMRARDAIQVLDRKELAPQLVTFLGEPAPGDPEERDVPQAQEGKKTCVVREVVRINHHRNCLLCHPPSQTGNTQEVPGVIPIPGTPFPSSPREAYGQAQSQGEPMVRADTTYLRQDFSVMMQVEHANPWPAMQRFDFLVRTRVVEGKELAALQERVQTRAAGFLSANHKAAIEALEGLTGQSNVGTTQAAWQRVLTKAGE
jgi:hypothetical protein